MTKISVLVIIITIFILAIMVNNIEFKEYRLVSNKDKLDKDKLYKEKLDNLGGMDNKDNGYYLKGGGRAGGGRSGGGRAGGGRSSGTGGSKGSIDIRKNSNTKISGNGAAREIFTSPNDRYAYSRSPLRIYRPTRWEYIDADIDNIRRSTPHTSMYPNSYYYFNSKPTRRTNITDLNIYGNVDYKDEWKSE